MKKKKVFILFVSHKCGEHGLDVCKSMKGVQKALTTLIEQIHSDGQYTKEQKEEDLEHVEGVCNDYYAELADSTWFDVFEREV